jgi:hypothetical protein
VHALTAALFQVVRIDNRPLRMCRADGSAMRGAAPDDDDDELR